MTESEQLGDQLGPVPVDRLARLDPNRLGTLPFILSEAIFFTLLILAYLFYRGAPLPAGDPTAANSLDIGRTAIFTACLLASSVTIWLADRSLKAGREGALRLWLAATVVLGAVFLVGQGMEYSRLLSDHVTVNRNLFGTTFYTLTGFHGFHVFAGLLALSILLALALQGQFKGERHNSAITCVSLYWHFVDVVWIAVFSVVYLWNLV